jgi:hypothetical protein
MMADTVIFLLRRVASEMALERAEAAAAGAPLAPPPPPPLAAAAAAAWLPPPLVEGNFAERVEPTCHFGDELPAIVTTTQGFTFLADAEKPGYVTETVGSVIELSLPDTEKSITISYLRSGKPGMGAAAAARAWRKTSTGGRTRTAIVSWCSTTSRSAPPAATARCGSCRRRGRRARRGITWRARARHLAPASSSWA